MKRSPKSAAPPPAPDQQPYAQDPSEIHRLSHPHFAVLCNEKEEEFHKILEDLLLVYQPGNAAAFAVVRDIASARWQILRNEVSITNHWNLAIVEQSSRPLSVVPELAELQIMDRATQSVFTGSALVSKLTNEIDKLIRRIGRLERNLRFVNTHFGTRIIEPKPVQPPVATAPTAQPSPEPEPAEPPTEPAAPNTEQPIYITENTPTVIAYYQQLYPNRRIIVLPADDVARGIDVEDDMPDIPRRAA